MPSDLPDHSQTCVLIYDGECRMCVAAKTHLEGWRKRDGRRIVYLPYQGRDAGILLGDLVGRARPEVALFIAGDGTVHQGLDAFVELLPHLQNGRFLSQVLRLRPIRRLALMAYRLLARHRYRWFGAVKPPGSA